MSESEKADLAAMSRLVAGEERALGELMERWKIRLCAFLFRLTGSESVASDLAQEAFVRLYQNRLRFHPRGSERPFSTWLFGIATNLGRQHLRWLKRHPTVPIEDAGQAAGTGDPGQSAELEERGHAVRKAIAALPHDLREVLVLSEYEQLSQAAIATIADCSVKAVERRLCRAREILRKDLSRYLSS